ncbi:MAG: hypothetical protein V1725_05595 [archaeon]
MKQQETIFGKVDNISQFVHPIHHAKFHFLSLHGQVTLARRCVDAIVASGFRHVVVSETGASPLIHICKLLAQQRGLDIAWFPLKVPREPMQSMYPLLMYYLTTAERNERMTAAHIRRILEQCSDREEWRNHEQLENKTRSELLHMACTHIPPFSKEEFTVHELFTNGDRHAHHAVRSLIATILEGTTISKIFNRPFLYFDEYINSGTTLHSAMTYVSFFAKNPTYTIGTYFIYVHDTKQYEKIAFALHDLDTERACFDSGAYPFENRVDLIGHYYFIDDEEYVRVPLESVNAAFAGEAAGDAEQFIRTLRTAIHENKLTEALQDNTTSKEVRAYLQEDHVVRHLLTLFEKKTHGKKRYHEFLFQLAEMYGPVWSPMPRENHFDFWNALEKTTEKMMRIPEWDCLQEQYVACRPALLCMAAQACMARREQWLAAIEKIVEGNA